MKQIALTILFVLFVGSSAFAQEADSLQTQKPSVSVEELALKVDKLQHDYDFLWCEYKLRDLINDLNIKSNTLQITSNSIVAEAKHGGYNRALYNSYTELLDSYRVNYKATKDLISTVKTAILVKIVMGNFSDDEKEVIYAGIESVRNSESAFEASINHYEAALKIYRGW